MVSGVTNIRRYNLPVVQTAGSVNAADIAVVSKLLRHASIAITADLVGTVASDAVNVAANLIAHTQCAHVTVWALDAGVVFSG